MKWLSDTQSDGGSMALELVRTLIGGAFTRYSLVESENDGAIEVTYMDDVFDLSVEELEAFLDCEKSLYYHLEDVGGDVITVLKDGESYIGGDDAATTYQVDARAITELDVGCEVRHLPKALLKPYPKTTEYRALAQSGLNIVTVLGLVKVALANPAIAKPILEQADLSDEAANEIKALVDKLLAS